MSNYGRKKISKSKELDEVEELLRATEEAMLLKLSVNSHLSHTCSSSSPLDQDLLSRFEALKRPSVSKKTTKVPSKSVQLKENKNEGDPFARFSALKGGSSSSSGTELQLPASSGGDVSEEDEVSKLMQWAMDAARLDPSVSDKEEDECVSSDGDDDLEEEDDDYSDDDTEDEKEKKKETSKNRK